MQLMTDAGTGESNGGGQGEDFLVYQTATATPPASIVGGTSVGSVMGPEEDSSCIVAYANSAVNSAGANGVTYDVEFYGSATDTQGEQIAVMNAAVFQANADGLNISELAGYPYSGTATTAAAEINTAEGIPIIVIINGTINT
jgi:hypothetical protein